MNINNRIDAFVQLGKWIEDDLIPNHSLLQQAYYHNKWFTQENIKTSLLAIAHHYLQEEKLLEWTQPYTFLENNKPKRIGIIMAGNLPLVGFHDLLCVLISGNIALIKLSSKDKILLPFITQKLIEIAPYFQDKIIYMDILKDINGIIATGGNNAARYFDYYFGKYPNIIRKNRNSIAVLSGNETEEQLLHLGEDVFQYFGLGCRNVSFIFIPNDYDIRQVLQAWEGKYNYLMEENIYKNNYDYNRTLLLMNKVEHLASDYVMLQPSKQIPSPISVIHYFNYNTLQDVEQFIAENEHQIQCIVSALPIKNSVAFGNAQQPTLHQYADDINTMEFLQSLSI